MTKQSLDELVRTMSVIPSSKLNGFVDGYYYNDCFMKSISLKARCFLLTIIVLFTVYCLQPITAQNTYIPNQSTIDSINSSFRIATDTSFKWHPETIYVELPDMQFEFQLPHKADQAGVANLLFQDRASGEIHLLDTIKLFTPLISFDAVRHIRYYTLFTQGKYDAILLYNNGKYIRYSDIIFETGVNSVVNMEELPILPADSESQHWLGLRGFMASIGTRNLPENYTTDKGRKIRGYLFCHDGSACGAYIQKLDGDNEGVVTESDGYFEIGVDDYQTLQYSSIGISVTQRNIKSNSGLFIVLGLNEKDKELLDSINIRTGTLISR